MAFAVGNCHYQLGQEYLLLLQAMQQQRGALGNELSSLRSQRDVTQHGTPDYEALSEHMHEVSGKVRLPLRPPEMVVGGTGKCYCAGALSGCISRYEANVAPCRRL